MPRKKSLPRELTFPSDLGMAKTIQAEVEAALTAADFSEREVFAVRLALEEALVNAIKHGNRLDPTKKVHVRWSVTPDRFDIRIADEGPGFDPCCVPDPTADENLERPCGRGVFLIKHYMTKVVYTDGGRVVEMCKIRNGRG